MAQGITTALRRSVSGLSVLALVAVVGPAAAADDDAAMGLALRANHTFLGLDRGVPQTSFGLSVSQHARFSRWFGAQVTVGGASGVDAHGRLRTDLEFVMPAVLFFFPTRDAIRPYVSTGVVMTTSFYHGELGGMVYAGVRAGLGFEARAGKKLGFLFELTTVARARFAVDPEDRTTLDKDPVLDRQTAVVHEGGLSLGVVLY